jgi:hypothetical protein
MESTVRVGLLNNLRAGRSRDQVSQVLEGLRDHPDVLHVETDSAHVLPEALGEFARSEVDLLVVNGGDGTLQFALTELLTNPEFASVKMVAPLRGGRTNMTALDLGAARNPAKALHHLLVDVEQGNLAPRTVHRPVLRVSSSRRAGPLYGMFFGGGLLQRAIQLTHRLFPSGRSHGVLGPGIVTGTLLTRMFSGPSDGITTPDKAEIRIDDEIIDDAEFYLTMATSLDRLFLRMNPFWGNGGGGVRFTSIASRVERFARATPPILRGKPPAFATAENGYTSANADRVELRFGCGFTVDGEIFEPQPDEVVTVEADRRIQFVRA